MRRRALWILSSAMLVSMLAVVGWNVWQAREGERLVSGARSRLDASLVDAPELDRIQASTAISLLERAERLGHGGAWVIGLSHLARAIEDLQKGDLILSEGELVAARQRLGGTADVHLLEATLARARDDASGASRHVARALALAPRNRRALLLAADLALDRNDGRAALVHLEPLVRLEPRAAVVRNRLALARLAVGDARRAEGDLRAAIRLDSRDPAPWINLGRVLRDRGASADARDAFTEAIRRAPGNADAHLGRGLCRAALGDLRGALPDLVRSAELAPNQAEPLLALGDLAARSGDLPGAISAYREALARDAGDAAAWVKLGNALARSGDPGPAVTAYREALSRSPGLAAAHNGLGAALSRVGEPAEAAAALERAAALDAHDANPLLNLAMLRERTGDRTGARDAWRAALTRDPDNRVARHRLGLGLGG